MASYTQTISNSFNLFGNGKANRWGDVYGSNTTLTWQSAGVATYRNYWGAQDDLELLIHKGISESLDLSSTIGSRNIVKQITDSLDLSSTVGKAVTRFFANILGLESTLTTLTKGNGDWVYVYPDNTTNAVERYEPTWSQMTEASGSWTQVANTTTSWTGV